jgi:hypothetical protein
VLELFWRCWNEPEKQWISSRGHWLNSVCLSCYQNINFTCVNQPPIHDCSCNLTTPTPHCFCSAFQCVTTFTAQPQHYASHPHLHPGCKLPDWSGVGATLEVAILAANQFTVHWSCSGATVDGLWWIQNAHWLTGHIFCLLDWQ